MHDRHEHVQAGYFDLAAMALDLGDQLVVDDRVEDDARCLFDFGEHTGELALGADQRMHVLDGPHICVLNGRRLGDGGQRFTGRIRDQMQVKVTRQDVGHLWIKSRVMHGRPPGWRRRR